MSRGIIIFGAPGSGQTSIGRELAMQLGFTHIDLDDYHWRWDTEIPYTIFRPAEERIEHLIHDLSDCDFFLMSGSMWSMRKIFEPLFDMAVLVTVPAEIRAERIRLRETNRWGNRILPGGDMYETNKDYSKDWLERALEYDTAEPSQFGLKQHEQWINELTCPVLRIDGTKNIMESAEIIAAEYSKLL